MGGKLPGKSEQGMMNPKMGTFPPSEASRVEEPSQWWDSFWLQKAGFHSGGKWILSMSTEDYGTMPTAGLMAFQRLKSSEGTTVQ